ncbi:P-loop containing nucleoside triphosphate hydrolase protein, partial [Aureobasidium melanogenum]
MFVASDNTLLDPFQWIPTLCIAASLCFIVTGSLRWYQLQKSTIKIAPNQQESIKFAFNLALLAFQSSIVGLSMSLPIESGTLDEYVHLVAIVGLAILSPREHYRSVSPSDLLIIYLSIRTALNASALLMIRGNNSVTVQVLRTILEAGALIAESRSKRNFLLEAYLDIAPEETAGPWSKATFAWIHPILFAGKDSKFVLETLPLNPRQLNPSVLRQKVLRLFGQREKPESRLTFPSVLAQCLMPEFATIAITRFMLIAFRYAQPLLMSRILQLLATNALGGRSYQLSCTIVIFASIVYVGQAIVSSRYQHKLNRLKVMTRATLVELIYEKTLSAPAVAYNDYSAATLMSTDVDALAKTSEMFHEAWAQVLEVIVGMVLLSQQIGWFCLVPLPIIYGCSHMTRYVARSLRLKQLAWNKATQDRINRIVSVVVRIKIIKMLGLGNVVRDQISCLRQTEIDASKDMRWVAVLANASANALGLFTPAITIILFAAMSRSKLGAETAYTTLAILLLVTHPANMIMTIVPRAIASLASFQRIQDFVNKPHYQDARRHLQNEEAPTLIDASCAFGVAVKFRDVELKFSGSTTPILEGIDLSISHGSIVVCTGPTGAGKGLLGLAIAGEVKASKGSIFVVSTRIGLCTQLPWLPGQCIPETITGFSRTTGVHHDNWYQQFLDACCIDDSILLSPAAKHAGSGHARFSGGQRQRVALARAVYQRHQILVLDDPLSALDHRTQERVIVNLLGPGGLLRNSHTMVFLITSAPAAYSLADRILLLKHGRIEFDGDWSSFRTHAGSFLEDSFVDGDEAKTDYQQRSELMSVEESKLAVNDDELDIDTRSGDPSAYRYYLRSVGVVNMLALLSCTALYSFFSAFPHYWIKWWTQAGATKNTFYMLGYLLCSTVAWASTSSMLWVNFIKLAPRSGAVLHTNLLRTILGAPLSFFLDNDTGVIVNRFGQDIQVIDRDLSSALAALCTQMFKLLIQCSLLLASQRLLLFALPIYCFLVYIIQKVYLRAASQLRYLDLESRSAVYSSFLETVEGLFTIRAFGWQQQYLTRNTRSLDLSQRAFYLFLCLQRWLNVVLDLAVAVVAIVVISLAVFCSAESADVGISLNIVLVTNTTLLRLIESWTTFEVSVGAAARLKELEDRVPNEENLAIETMVPCNWPCAGSLSLRGVRVCHGNQVILSNVDLSVQAGAKVFICGETGSGKSTLFMALLRLCPVQQGSLQVDGVEIAQAAPSIVRERCFIAVPQDAFLQPDISLRSNVDPVDRHSTEEITQALQQLHLWSHFQDADSSFNDPDNGDGHVLALPLSCFSPLSAGQTQLLSLVRSILGARYQARQGRKPIILLDEPTANLDDEYESLSSQVIEQEFTDKGHTVLMITHSSKVLRELVKPAKDVVIRINNGSMSVVA